MSDLNRIARYGISTEESKMVVIEMPSEIPLKKSNSFTYNPIKTEVKTEIKEKRINHVKSFYEWEDQHQDLPEVHRTKVYWVFKNMHQMAIDFQIQDFDKYIRETNLNVDQDTLLQIMIDKHMEKMQTDEQNAKNQSDNKQERRPFNFPNRFLSFRSRSLIKNSSNQDGPQANSSFKLPDKQNEPGGFAQKPYIMIPIGDKEQDSRIEMVDNSCPICFGDLNIENQLTPLSCKHTFCRPCVENYIKHKYNTSDLLNIRCPYLACPALFEDDNVGLFLPRDEFKKFLELKKTKLLNENPNIRWCTRLGCQKYMIGSEQNPRLICECGNEFCFHCRENWHEGRTCQQQIEDDFKNLTKARPVKLCPNCKIRTEKDLGCDHMTCALCKYEYCWLCLEHYTPSHFQENSITRCKQKQWVRPYDYVVREERARERRRRIKDCICNGISAFFTILCLIISSVCLPFACLFCSGLAPYSYCKVQKETNRLGCCFGLLIILLGIFTFPLPLIIWLIVVLYNQCASDPIECGEKWLDQFENDFNEYSPITDN